MPRKGTTSERGYGSDHRKERARWVRIQQEGGEHQQVRGLLLCRADPCRMPSQWIGPGEAWDLGHDEHGRWRGPEHDSCNRSEGAARGNRMRGPRRAPVYRGHLSVDARDL